MSGEDVYTRWMALEDEEITVEDIQMLLVPLQDDLWVAAACADRLLDDPVAQRALLDLGLQRTKPALDRSRAAYESADDDDDDAGKDQRLKDHLAANPADAQLFAIRASLRSRLARLDTFIEIIPEFPPLEEGDDVLKASGSSNDEGLGGEDWEDDPWANDGEAEDGEDSKQAMKSRNQSKPRPSPIPLSQFLLDHLAHSASLLAALECVDALRVLWRRHAVVLWPYRLAILGSIPEHVPPSGYYDLLPAYDAVADKEAPTPKDASEREWMGEAAVQQLLSLPAEPPADLRLDAESLDGNSLSAWYLAATERIVSSTGMPDPALELLQYGAGQGVPALDEAGEDLSLLARLVYDAPAPRSGASEDWTLEQWRSLSPHAAVQAYLRNATPANAVPAIRSLVMPYLYVQEARAERAGAPDPQLPTRTLETYVMNAPLEMASAVFEASKPIFPAAQRLIRSDEECVRLALATLYGSERRDAWGVMSGIFECLPAWDVEDEDNSSAETTLASLGAFVAPTTARARATPEELFVFFKPLPAAALSRALDILDVHLESGEIMSRWGVLAPLRWFLQSHDDASAQRSWAVRMARMAAGLGERVDTEDEWEGLLDDMLKLSRHGAAGLRGAFGLLERDEVIRIFFSGLLSTGDFDIARVLLHKTRTKLSLAPSAVEDICVSCSREFYDNASSGNYKMGDMKLAYDCLSIPSPSQKIISEKEFIEATSRIASFNVTSRGGMPISPIEIRLTQDKLSLVARVLSSTPDAYKHADMLLELAHKLGFRGDAGADAAVLGMAADTALQAEDFVLAHETCSRLVAQVLALPAGVNDEQKLRAREVAWVACYQLGRQPEFEDIEKKKVLLGRALELCPAEQMPDVLGAWRKLDVEARAARAAHGNEKRGRRRQPRKTTDDTDFLASPLFTSAAGTLGAGASSLAARLQSLRSSAGTPSSPLAHAPDAAALASRALGRVAGAAFSFIDGQRERSVDSSVRTSRESSLSRPGSAVPAQASRAFQKGMSWLIGADEQ